MSIVNNRRGYCSCLILVLTFLSLAACTDNEEPASNRERKENIWFTVSGDLNHEMARRGLFICSEQDFSVVSMAKGVIFSMDLPRSITVGEHDYEDKLYSASNADGIVISYTYTDENHKRSSFDHGQGVVDIAAIPTKKGEAFKATFSVTLENKDSAQVKLEGKIDVVASTISFGDC